MSLTRREFVSRTAFLALGTALPGAGRASTDPAVASLDATGQAEAIARGDLTAKTMLEETFQRIASLNPMLNAVVLSDFEGATGRAGAASSGAFAGVPILIKDMTDTAGLRTTYGSRAYLGNVPEVSDPYVTALERAGFNVCGKTNTAEFGLTATTESLALGPCYNPWNVDYSTGGSSGGAAASVASGMVAIAHATDGGGSIRIPAACCGVFGFKPSRGRNVGLGDEFTILHHGAITRTVRDAAGLLAATERAEPAPGLEPVNRVEGPSATRLRIGYRLQGLAGEVPDADVQTAFEGAVELCRGLGHRVEPFEIEAGSEAFFDAFLDLWASFGFSLLDTFEKQFGRRPTLQDFEPLTFGLAEYFKRRGPASVPESMQLMQSIAGAFVERLGSIDVLLTPTLTSPSVRIGYLNPALPFELFLERSRFFSGYTPIHNIAGTPAMSVPLAWNDANLPVGLQFSAAPSRERTLLELAYELEQSQPWRNRKPAINAF